MKKNNFWKRFWTLNVHNHEGFTLVELIIVIAILAILSSVAVVGYSAYIEKANKAADESLLYEINQAFRSACIENMCDVFDINSAVWDMDEMTVISVNGSTTHPIVEDFKTYFDVSNPEFKVIAAIVFDKDLHQFVDGSVTVSYTYNGTTIEIPLYLLNKLQNSTFASMTADELMSKVDELKVLEGIASEAGLSFEEQLIRVLGGDAEMGNTVASYLGIDPADLDTYIEENGLDPNAVLRNAAIVSIAASAGKMDAEDVTHYLNYGSWASGSDITAKAAQASALYAMYTAYMQSKDSTYDPSGKDYQTVLKEMRNDADFKAYLNTSEGKADVEGYLAAMSIISDNSENTDVTAGIVAGGFENNPDLEDLLNQMLGNG